MHEAQERSIEMFLHNAKKKYSIDGFRYRILQDAVYIHKGCKYFSSKFSV